MSLSPNLFVAGKCQSEKRQDDRLFASIVGKRDFLIPTNPKGKVRRPFSYFSSHADLLSCCWRRPKTDSRSWLLCLRIGLGGTFGFPIDLGQTLLRQLVVGIDL